MSERKTTLGPNTIYTEFDPKQSNRWLVKFPEEFGLDEWMVKHVTPIIYNPEKRKWDDITITLWDAVHKSTSKRISKLIEDGRMYNFNLKMIILDPVGENIEEFYFELCNITNIDFGVTDYEVSDFKVVTLGIKFKKCVIN